MGSVLNIYRKINTLDIKGLVVEAINETKDNIADFNAEQMFSGIRATSTGDNAENIFSGAAANGIPIDANGYAPFTIEEKKKKGQVTDRVTLKDAGAFYAGLTAKANRDTVSYYSTDEKSGLLEKRYSKTIFGLTKENKRVYRNGYFYNSFFSKLKEKLNL